MHNDVLGIGTAVKNNKNKVIQEAFGGLGVKKGAKHPPRSALGAFGEIVSLKMEKSSEVEQRKLDFEVRKYEDEKIADDKRLNIEHAKVLLIVLK